VGREPAATQHQLSDQFFQVLDFIQGSRMPPNWAIEQLVKLINQLASLWAGFAQSYPQLEWKAMKAIKNQPLGSCL
jgi:hypothetical protein